MQKRMKAVIDKFVTDINKLTREMALDVLVQALDKSERKGKPVTRSNFDPALGTQPMITKAEKAVTKAAKKIAKKAVKRASKHIAKANKRAIRENIPVGKVVAKAKR
jgi:hypothetical protein